MLRTLVWYIRFRHFFMTPPSDFLLIYPIQWVSFPSIYWVLVSAVDGQYKASEIPRSLIYDWTMSDSRWMDHQGMEEKIWKTSRMVELEEQGGGGRRGERRECRRGRVKRGEGSGGRVRRGECRKGRVKRGEGEEEGKGEKEEQNRESRRGRVKRKWKEKR